MRMQWPAEQLQPSTSELCSIATKDCTAANCRTSCELHCIANFAVRLQCSAKNFVVLHSALKVHLVDALPVPSQTKHLFLTTHRCICGVCIKTLPETQRNQGLTPKLANGWRFSKKFDHQVAPCASSYKFGRQVASQGLQWNAFKNDRTTYMFT